MLLIAQPKSASTSLAYTLGLINKLHVEYGIQKKSGNKNCEGFSEIQKYHNNMVQRNENFLKVTTKSRSIIFKEHLLPVDEHFKILEKLKQRIVILIREPEDSLDSYRRFFDTFGEKRNRNYKTLQKDLEFFHDRWMHWASNKPYAIVVEYRDLVLYFQNEIKRIQRHFNLGVSKKIFRFKLARKKYTGIGEKRVIDRTA